MDSLKTIQIESSTACNGRCMFCPRHDMKREGGEMSDELFHKIVNEGMAIGVTMFTPFLNGEPFMFPRLFEWLDYLKERDLRFTLYTNASTLTKEKADKINEYSNITELVFSMHGYDKASYELQMRLPYEKSKANVEYFMSIARIPYRVYMLASAINTPQIDTFKQTWGANVFIGKYVNWLGKRPSSMKGTSNPCNRALTEMTVYWDGRVPLCCMVSDDELIIGDLNKQSVSEVWESNQWMRNKHKVSDFDIYPCRDCNFNIN
jgi:radical SAM protein with 4Fe4S-binding SPASM domain